MRRAALAATLLLALPASAAANNARFQDTDLQFRAQEIAVDRWGELCDGDVEIWWESAWDEDTLAYALGGERWDRGGRGDRGERGGWRGWRCAVVFNPDIRWNWRMFCSIMVHEYGHLAGREHSDNPRSIMYPEYVRAYGPCKRRA